MWRTTNVGRVARFLQLATCSMSIERFRRLEASFRSKVVDATIVVVGDLLNLLCGGRAAAGGLRPIAVGPLPAIRRVSRSYLTAPNPGLNLSGGGRWRVCCGARASLLEVCHCRFSMKASGTILWSCVQHACGVRALCVTLASWFLAFFSSKNEVSI